MKQAEWTISPQVERDLETRRRRERWGIVHVVGAGIAGFGVIVVAVYFALYPGLPGLLAAMLLALVAVWLSRRDEAYIRTTEKSDQERRAEFGSGDGWLVDLLILQGAAPTGSDRGILWIEGARLCFAGDRTSFALGGNDLAERPRLETPIRHLRHSVRIPLAIRTDLRQSALSFEVLDGVNEDAATQIQAWWDRAPRFDGQFPPVQIGPGAPSHARIMGRILYSALQAAIFILALAVSFPSFEGMLGTVVFGLVLFSWLGGGAFILHCRAWRDLRRIQRRPTLFPR